MFEEAVRTGADQLLSALADNGVDIVFGYPGGAVLPLYDALFQQNRIRHIQTRHEQAAVHAAEGYARSTGKVGVVFVTSGPGMTNAITGLCDALMDSVSVLVISGQVATRLIGTDAFQEADAIGLTRAATKRNWQVTDAHDVQAMVREALNTASSGRPGPVLLDVPKDIQSSIVDPDHSPSERPNTEYAGSVSNEQIARFFDLVAGASKPVLLLGGGIISAGKTTCSQMQVLAQKYDLPVTATLMGLGAYPADNPNWLGMTGIHGTAEANLALHGCDLLIAAGARFDDRVTAELDGFSPNSRKVHIDIDPSQINRLVQVDLGISCDLRSVLPKFLKSSDFSKTAPRDLSDWWAQIEEWRSLRSLSFEDSGSVIKPQALIEALNAATKELAPFITTEVGQHQMWSAQRFEFSQPRHWVTSGGMGTMGFGLPAAIGIQVAHPDALVMNIAGEASAMMNMHELGTLSQYRLPVKQVILNNGRLGMVSQWQQLHHGERYSSSWSEALPDFTMLARSFGIKSARINHPEQMNNAIVDMLEHPGPYLLECVVDHEESVFPMIPSGCTHDRLLLSKQDMIHAKALIKAGAF